MILKEYDNESPSMKNNITIHWLPKGLYLEDLIIHNSYYDFAELFICRNSKNDLYLVCSIMLHAKYKPDCQHIIISISEQMYFKLLIGEITLHQVFNTYNEKFLTVKTINNKIIPNGITNFNFVDLRYAYVAMYLNNLLIN